MKDVRIKYVLSLFAIGTLLSCSLKQGRIHETKQGTYIIKVKTNAQADAVIYGILYDYDNKSALHYPRVQANNSATISADINGKFKMVLNPGKYRFTGKGLPYQFVTTKPVVIKRGDSVEVNFYLKPYNKPLY